MRALRGWLLALRQSAVGSDGAVFGRELLVQEEFNVLSRRLGPLGEVSSVARLARGAAWWIA